MAIDYARQREEFRRRSTTSRRVAEARLNVDPGFVHHRKIESLIGGAGIKTINDLVEQIPDGLPQHLRDLQVDQIYSRLAVDFCALNEVPTLGQLLAGTDSRLFTSIETSGPTSELREHERAVTVLVPKGESAASVRLEYGTKHIVADTMWTQLARGAELAIVALLRDRDGDVLTFEPLLMGGPMLSPSDPQLVPDAMFLGYAFGELFVEDIDEFARVADVEVPDDITPMKDVGEFAFKTCIAEILGQDAPKDWGGEQSDLYSPHLHVGGKRMTAAFLLKGPAKFSPMALNTLGKNNDQIVRLAQEPARLLIVQHCHEISQPVRETLRAFTIRPGSLDRRYCCIDGKDSLRILRAYGKLDRALELSAGSSS